MTHLSTRLQSVAGGLEIQLGNLRTVSPRSCHCRALWPRPALAAGLAMWSAFLTKRRSDTTSMVRGIVSAREGTMLHHERCGQARNVSSQGRTGTQSIPATTPTGEHFWTEMEGSWPNIFIVWCNLNIFHRKENKNTIIIIMIIKRTFFSPALSSQGLRNPKDWVSIKRILPGTHRNWGWEPHIAWV